jgi:transketolase
VRERGPLETILLATGSEVQHAVAAAAQLGPGARVVSLPCWEAFERQDRAYRDEVLPPTCRRRVSIEAGVTHGWERWVGDGGRAIGIDRFGASAPGHVVFEKLGVTAQAVVDAARALG